MDYYKILNLKEDASLKEIEQAYLDLSSFYNPKNNVSKVAYKKYREINKAYNVLKQIKQREMFNLSLKQESIDNSDNVEYGRQLDVNYFDKNDYTKEYKNISEYEDEIATQEYIHLEVKVPYLYSLVNSEYVISYPSSRVVKIHDSVCKECLGIGKVRVNNKVVRCSHCLGQGKEVTKEKVLVTKSFNVNENIFKEDSLYVEWDFYDKDSYVVNGNEIIYRHEVSEEEYYHGLEIFLKNNDTELKIVKNDFSFTNDNYIFEDKIIKIDWILSEYKGRDKNGIVVTSEKIIYLDLKDYSFTYKSDSTHTFKVELNSDYIVLDNLGDKGYNDSNGNLILKVVRIDNHDDLKILFDREIKKVGSKLFKLSGTYLDHKFKGNKTFEYDDKYLYIPFMAYKVKMKCFNLFKALFIISYILVPAILYFLLGLSLWFFICSFIYMAIYLFAVNFLVEVKV